MNKKSINNSSCVPKNETPNVKNFQIIPWLGTKHGHDKEKQENRKPIEKNDDYSNVQKQKELFQNYTKIFQEIATQEDRE